MRLFRFCLLAVPAAAALLAACRDDKITSATLPPLAGVRYIHAVPDTGRVDIKMYDQLEYSANTIDGVGGVVFRGGTRYFDTEAKTRKIRVFSFQDSSITTVSQVMLDTTMTFEANKNYTLLLVGSARATAGSANRMRFVQIEDAPPTDNATVLLKTQNLSATPYDLYVGTIPDSVGKPTTGAATLPGFAGGASTAYTVRAPGAFGIALTAPGTPTVLARVAAAAGAAGTPQANPIAGATVGGTAFSAYVFPGAVAGSGAVRGQSAAATAVLVAPGVQLFVDRRPPNTVAGS